ncbi:hypothetical protein BH09MYX1_BH09MYX1_26010 [soil metagenome]
MAYRKIDPRRAFGVASGPFTGEHEIAIDRMTRDERSSLADRILRGETRAILSRRVDEGLIAGCMIVVLALGAIAMIASWRFGELDGPPQSAPGWAVVYGLLGGLAAVGGYFIARALHHAGAPPFPQGTFLFPLDLLEIEGRTIRVTPFGDARFAEIDEERKTVVIEYASGRVVRLSGSPGGKLSLLAQLLSAQQRLEEASARGSSTADVLTAIRTKKLGWESVAPIAPPRPPLKVAPIHALFLAISVAAGVLGWSLRVRANDDAAYSLARAIDDRASYASYLAIGTRHAAEVRDDRIPTLAKRAAGQDIELLDRVIDAHPTWSGVEAAKKELHGLCVTHAASAPPITRGPTVPREAAICAVEIADLKVDRAVAARDYTSIFALTDGRASATQIARAQKGLDRLLQSDIAQIDRCVGSDVKDGLHALIEIVRTQHRVARLEIVKPTDLPDLPRFTDVLRALVPASIRVNVVSPDWSELQYYSGEADAHFRIRHVGGQAYSFVIAGVAGTHVEKSFIASCDADSNGYSQEDVLRPIGIFALGEQSCGVALPKVTVRVARTGCFP